MSWSPKWVAENWENTNFNEYPVHPSSDMPVSALTPYRSLEHFLFMFIGQNFETIIVKNKTVQWISVLSN